jgi:hypothetical protein
MPIRLGGLEGMLQKQPIWVHTKERMPMFCIGLEGHRLMYEWLGVLYFITVLSLEYGTPILANSVTPLALFRSI